MFISAGQTDTIRRMAIYHLRVKIISRSNKTKSGTPTGKKTSVVAKAAYRSGKKLKDVEQNQTYDYSKRVQEIVHQSIIAPEDAPEWARDRESLWNKVEEREKRVDSQLAKEYEIALPKELNKKQQIELMEDWCKTQFADKGFIADLALHKSKKGINPHAHILVTTRPLENGEFGKKPVTAGKWNGRGSAGYGAKDELEAMHIAWEEACNAALKQAGKKERIDHRSYEKQGIDKIPQPKMGVSAKAMEEQGIETRRGEMIRDSRIEEQIKIRQKVAMNKHFLKQATDVLRIRERHSYSHKHGFHDLYSTKAKPPKVDMDKERMKKFADVLKARMQHDKLKGPGRNA